MNRTAVLHSASAVSFVAAILVQQTPIRIGLGVLAVAGLVGGIVLARREDGTDDTSE